MDRLKVLEKILSSCHSFAINMNDTFYYACADSSQIDSGDMEDLLPIIDKYGFDAFVAYEAIKRGHDPQIPKNANDPKFKAAKQEILDIVNRASEYGEFYDLREYLKQEAQTIEAKEKEIRNKKPKKGWFSFFMENDNESYY